MTDKKIGFYQKYIKPHVDIVMFFTIIGMGITGYIEYKSSNLEDDAKIKEIEQKIYPDVLTLQRAMDHDNEVPSDIENYKRERHLISTGDTLKEYQKEIKKNIKVIDSFYQFSKAQSIKDSINDIIKQKSRDKRTNDVNDIKTNQQNIVNTLQAIQRILDTIN